MDTYEVTLWHDKAQDANNRWTLTAEEWRHEEEWIYFADADGFTVFATPEWRVALIRRVPCDDT